MTLAEEEWWGVPFQIFRISLISAISRTLLNENSIILHGIKIEVVGC